MNQSGTSTSPLQLHVVAGVVRDGAGRILLSYRLPPRAEGGLWEFPGGKLDPGEAAVQGLRRELREELGIEVEAAMPLIAIRHQYPDKLVLLDVWEVVRWSGTPQSLEGQPLAWCHSHELTERAFPAANGPIVRAVRLPRLCLISPEPTDPATFLQALDKALGRGVQLVQLRAKTLTASRLATLAEAALACCRRHQATLIINGDLALAERLGVGAHLTSPQLSQFQRRPLASDRLLSAACHTLEDVRQAERLEVDFALLGPVNPTASHPTTAPLGWHATREIARAAQLPIYALGGQGIATLATAVDNGCLGIAAIRGLWETPLPAVEAVARAELMRRSGWESEMR